LNDPIFENNVRKFAEVYQAPFCYNIGSIWEDWPLQDHTAGRFLQKNKLSRNFSPKTATN
jgi:hypothetical protein